MNQIEEQLFALQDLKYRDFHARLMPGYEKENIIGVRTPALRKLAKELAKKMAADQKIAAIFTHFSSNRLQRILIQRFP